MYHSSLFEIFQQYYQFNKECVNVNSQETVDNKENNHMDNTGIKT